MINQAKLYNLEKKQDFLEVETSKKKGECLKHSDANNKELTQNLNTWKDQKQELECKLESGEISRKRQEIVTDRLQRISKDLKTKMKK